MSVLNLCGFESGDVVECYAAVGTQSISSAVKRTGDYSGRVNPTTTATGSFRLGTFQPSGLQIASGSVSQTLARFYFRVDTLPASGNEEIFVCADAGALTKFSIRITSAGVLQAWSRTPSQLGSDGTTILSTGVWYRIDVKVYTGTNAS